MRQALRIIKYITSHPLSGKHKIKSVYNFFKWQITQTLFPKMVEYPFVGNTKFYARKGMEAATANIYTGLHEFNEMGFLLHFLRSEDMFVDVGANIGAYTILASGYIGCKSICIEPVLVTYDILLKNINLNKIADKVDALNIGVGATKGILHFTKTKDSGNHVVLISDNKQEGLLSVDVDSLDDVFKNKDCPLLIKIDVEGFEQEVINGAAKLLSNIQLKAIIIELIGEGKRYGFDEDNIRNQLLNYGFLPYQYYPYERRLSTHQTEKSDNIIYIRDIDFVTDRITNAKSVKIFSQEF